jgi:hypothetical protein
MTDSRFESPVEHAPAERRFSARWGWADNWSLAMAALIAILLTGGVIMYAVDHSRTAMLPPPSTTGQGIPGPMTPATP